MKSLVKFILGLLPKSLRYSVYRSMVKVPSELPRNLVFKIAETKEELEAAFVMLHDAYVGVGLLGQPDPSGIRVTQYNALPSSTTLIGKVGDEVVATMTIVRDSHLGLAADSFVDLSPLRKGGDRIAEISALAIKQGYRGKLLMHLLKFMYESCVNYLGVNHLIAMLSRKTKGYELYESVLFFTPFGEQKMEVHPQLNSTPLKAMHLNLDEAYSLFEKHYSGRSKGRDLFGFFTKEVLACNQFPPRHFSMINYPVMNIENFRYFFMERTTVLKSMTPEKLFALREIYQGLPQEKLIDQALRVHNVVPFKSWKSKTRFEVSHKTLAKVDNDRYVPIRVLDVSRQGLRVSSKERLGNEFEVVLKVQGGRIHHVVAKKVWQDEYGVVGLQVLQADDHWHEMISFFEGNKVQADYKKVRRAN